MFQASKRSQWLERVSVKHTIFTPCLVLLNSIMLLITISLRCACEFTHLDRLILLRNGALHWCNEEKLLKLKMHWSKKKSDKNPHFASLLSVLHTCPSSSQDKVNFCSQDEPEILWFLLHWWCQEKKRREKKLEISCCTKILAGKPDEGSRSVKTKVEVGSPKIYWMWESSIWICC